MFCIYPIFTFKRCGTVISFIASWVLPYGMVKCFGQTPKKTSDVQNRAARLVLHYQFRPMLVICIECYRGCRWRLNYIYDCWYIFTRYSSIILLVFSLKSLFMWDLFMIIKHVKWVGINFFYHVHKQIWWKRQYFIEVLLLGMWFP